MANIQFTTVLSLALAVAACAKPGDVTKAEVHPGIDGGNSEVTLIDFKRGDATDDATVDETVPLDATIDEANTVDAAIDEVNAIDAMPVDAAADESMSDGAIIDAALDADSGVDARPPTWKIGELSACSTTCGGGMQTRTVECVSEDGATLGDAMCKEPKPTVTQACIASAGCSWRTGAFGGCSSVCGTGTQTRDVNCVSPDGASVDAALCNAARPASSQTCLSTASCRWWTSTWGACSVSCGTGMQARMVACVDPVGQVVPGSYCTAAMPNGRQACSRPACTVYVVGEPTAANGPCYKPGCIGPTPSYPACPAGYVVAREETACGNPSACNGNWALCTFRDVAGYGCNGADYSMPVAVRECRYQQ